MTPRLSVDADHDSSVPEVVVPEAANVVTVLGGSESIANMEMLSTKMVFPAVELVDILLVYILILGDVDVAVTLNTYSAQFDPWIGVVENPVIPDQTAKAGAAGVETCGPSFAQMRMVYCCPICAL